MYICLKCNKKYSQAYACSESFICAQCGDERLVPDKSYNSLIEGSRNAEGFVIKLIEMMKKIDDDTLPESFIIDKKSLSEMEEKFVGKGRKRAIRHHFSQELLKVSIQDKEKEDIAPLIINVKL